MSGALLAGGVGMVAAPTASAGTVLDFNESFMGASLSNASNWVAGQGGSESACLTGLARTAAPIALAGGTTLPGCSNSPDGAGLGALRLVGNTNGQSASLIYTSPLPTAGGLDITFKMALYNGTADGLTFFLKDGANADDVPGAPGAALGYGPYEPNSQSGAPGGLLGIGFDRYGNFANTFFDSASCPDSGPARPDAITVRGPGSGYTGYCYLAGTAAGGVSYSHTATTRSAAARQVRIVVDRPTETAPKVRVYFGVAGSALTTPTLTFDVPAELKAVSTFKFGFAASTGGENIKAEVWDLGIDPIPACDVVPFLVEGAATTTAAGTTVTAFKNNGLALSSWPDYYWHGTSSNGFVPPVGTTWTFSPPVSELEIALGAHADGLPDNTERYDFTGSASDGTSLLSWTVIDKDTTRVFRFGQPLETLTAVYSPTTGVYGSVVRLRVPSVAGACSPYTMTYNANGGTGSVPVDEAMYANEDTTTVAGAGSLSRTGYQFSGWRAGPSSGTAYAVGSTYTFGMANANLYAQWTAETYTVTYDANTADTVTGMPAAATATYAASFTAGAAPSRVGYSFRHWSTSPSADVDTRTAGSAFTWDYTEGKTLYAVWGLNSYTVTYDGNATDTVTGLAPAVSVDYNAAFTMAAAPQRDGYRFLGWNTASDGSGTGRAAGDSFTWRADGGATFFAQWMRLHVLTVNSSGSGTVTGAGTYDSGTVVTIVATPGSGHYFAGWGGACSGQPSTVTVTMDAAKSCQATFEAFRTMTVDRAGNGSVAVGPFAGPFVADTRVTLTATPAEGQTFTGWGGDCSGTANPLTVRMDTSKRCTANFVTVFRVETAVSGNGSVRADRSLDAPIRIGETVTLTAVPGPREMFTGWSGSCSGTTNPLTITVDAAKRCTATFISLGDVPSGAFGAINSKASRLTWQPAANATGYIITVDGKQVCTTSDTTCVVPALLGPNSKVFAVAVNGELRATPVRLDHSLEAPVRIFVVRFAEGSAALTAPAKRTLVATAQRMTKLGFTSVRVAGYTDDQGGATGASALSGARAKAVVKFLGKYLQVQVVAAGYGNTNFVASNATEAGRAANRRAEGWVQ